MKIPLTKFISQSGYCSRRQAEELIRKGSVFVDNKKAVLGQTVDENDNVKINKEIIRTQKEKIYIKLNKPIGYVCTNKKFKNEKSIFELIDSKEKLFVVGRLDKNSQGLVLLTNDGDWAQKIMHPRYEHEKKYLIKFKNQNSKIKINEIVNTFIKGVDIGEGDGVVKAKKVKYIGNNGFEIILTEGKKRQIRRMFEVLGVEVKDLKRIQIGNVELGNLGVGKWAPLNKNEINYI